MYSNDIERMILNLNNLKDILTTQIDTLIDLIDYRIWNTEHVHPMHNPVVVEGLSFIGVGTTELARNLEDSDGDDYHPIQTIEITNPIFNEYQSGFEQSYQKTQQIKGQLYKNETEVNNCYGSPWGEFTKLTERIQKIREFQQKHPVLYWSNEKRGLLELMQVALSFTIDAKWSLFYYHDMLSRGFDEVYNDQKESIQWEYNTAKDKNLTKGLNFIKIDPNSNDPY